MTTTTRTRISPALFSVLGTAFLFANLVSLSAAEDTAEFDAAWAQASKSGADAAAPAADAPAVLELAQANGGIQAPPPATQPGASQRRFLQPSSGARPSTRPAIVETDRQREYRERLANRPVSPRPRGTMGTPPDGATPETQPSEM